MRRAKHLLYISAFSIVVLIVYIVGALEYINEADFNNFNYPLNVDVKLIVKEVRSGISPHVQPINTHNYEYVNKPTNKCDNIDVTVIVKSAMANFEERRAIRKTWGLESDVKGSKVRRVFLLGVGVEDDDVQRSIDKEAIEFNDIVQTKFLDTYYNNTIKTMTGFKWTYEYCRVSRFYLFADDDMFISMKHLLMFVNNPSEFLENSKTKDNSIDSDSFYNDDYKSTQAGFYNSDKTTSEDELYAGYVFHSAPLRIKTSKWYTSLEEYPWDMWPPYVTAGAYVVSNNVMINMYLASLYTKYFRFDDIYLAILAYKLDIRPMYCSEFYFRKIRFSPYLNRHVIAAHGYTPDELLSSWNLEKKYNRA